MLNGIKSPNLQIVIVVVFLLESVAALFQLLQSALRCIEEFLRSLVDVPPFFVVGLNLVVSFNGTKELEIGTR